MWFNLADRDSFQWSWPILRMLSVCQKQATKGMGFHKESSGDSVSIIPFQGCPHTSAKTQRGAFTRAPSPLFQRYPVTQAPSSEAGFSKHAVLLGNLWRSKHWQVMSQLPITIQQRRSLGEFPAHTVLLLSPADLDSSFSLLAFCLKFLFDLELPNYQIKWNEHDKKNVHWNLPQPFEETSNKTRKRANGHLPSDIKQKAAH